MLQEAYDWRIPRIWFAFWALKFQISQWSRIYKLGLLLNWESKDVPQPNLNNMWRSISKKGLKLMAAIWPKINHFVVTHDV